VIVKKGEKHEEKSNSNRPAGHNVLAASGNHRRFAFELKRLSTSTTNALFADLGKRVFSV
jgi:hypothetical protein